MLVIFTPGGIERLFVASGEPVDVARLPQGNGTPPGGLEALTAHYNLEHIGPPLGA